MAHAKAGDEIVCSAAIYGGTLHLLQDVLARFGVTPRFVSLEELATPDRVIGDRTRMRVVRVADQPDAALRRRRSAIAEACRARGVLSVIDNTFASPINQQPLALGVDLGDAERDQVPERPQRRHRRRRDRAGARCVAPIEKARRHGRDGDGSASRPTRWAAG